LQRPFPGSAAAAIGAETVQVELINADQLLRVFSRQWLVVASCIGFAILAAVGYTMTAVPLYTSDAQILIDSNNGRLVEELAAIGGVITDDGSVLSQVELIKSDSIALSVADRLALIDDSEFMANQTSLLGSVLGFLVNLSRPAGFADDFGYAMSPEQARQLARAKLQGGLDVRRVGRTYVLVVSYRSTSPALSAKVAQGYVEAYLADQLSSKYDAATRATTWMEERIAALRKQSLDSDLAVQKFRAENGLITAGGELLSDQQLVQLNAQLVSAQGDTAAAEAKLQSIREIINAGDVDAVVTDAISNSIINDMRSKYLATARREAEVATLLGSEHETVIGLRAEMDEYRRQMFEELGRIAASDENAVAVARAHQQSLEGKVRDATVISASANDSMVQLRELQREADAYRELYQTFLQRYQEAANQQSFPVTEARIISDASHPTRPTEPSLLRALAVAIAAGAVIGGLIAAVREFRDRNFRTGEQVRSKLGLEFLGAVPLLRDGKARRTRALGGILERAPKTIARTRSLTSYVVDQPQSQFAETLRGVKIALDIIARDKKTKTIGVVSCSPGEGKSIIAINLAQLLARQGMKTLLIDGDLRNPFATRALVSEATNGLNEALLEGTAISELVQHDDETGLALLPASGKRATPYSSELLSSAGFDRVMAEAQSYEYIVIDLPPLATLVDARSIVGKVDTFLLVVEWGRTSRSFVLNTLSREWMVADKCAGVVLNKVNTAKQRLYDPNEAPGPYGARYALHRG
jgi:succinoglycan biosynthesis transport protein ExoP